MIQGRRLSSVGFSTTRYINGMASGFPPHSEDKTFRAGKTCFKEVLALVAGVIGAAIFLAEAAYQPAKFLQSGGGRLLQQGGIIGIVHSGHTLRFQYPPHLPHGPARLAKMFQYGKSKDSVKGGRGVGNIINVPALETNIGLSWA